MKAADRGPVTGSHDVFLSYSRNDRDAAINLRGQLERCGFAVFRDEEKIREGELWLTRLQEEVAACRSFVVLVGRDGVQRWIGAETEVALSRHFGPRDDAQRLPIYPILLGETDPAALPAFLHLFQSTRWNGIDPLPQQLLDQIRDRTLATNDRVKLEGCPFVGLDAFRTDQAQLFFGRQKETLDALACFDIRPGSPTIRWLEIDGNSGSGKSSLMNAGLLPLVDKGWLWPRTGFEHWRVIGPMMPGEHPMAMLAEQLALAFATEMQEVLRRLESDGSALAMWLRSRKEAETAFLLAIDQFEELFAFADPDERARFDRLLADALEDADCPLFVISTVRADFLDRFEDLPRLAALRNRSCRPWTLLPIGSDGLREVIAGPARLAGLDVRDVQEAMVAEARDEPGALPLVENALHWLWEEREGNRLSGKLFTDHGGLAGILSESADGLLDGLGKQREQAMELLFRLVKVDPESGRHTRRRMPFTEAVGVAGGGERGRALVGRLAGERTPDALKARGRLRLITVTQEADGAIDATDQGGWVNLIHETLVRSKGLDAAGKPQPYWRTLWRYVEAHRQRAARRERLELLAREWQRRTGPARIFGLAGWLALFGFWGLGSPGSIEQRYLRWSTARALIQAALLIGIVGAGGESVYWAKSHGLRLEALTTRWAYKLGMHMPFPDFPKSPVPKGQFQMGGDRSEGENPIHPVAFAQPLYFTRTEIIVAQYRPFAEATGRDLPSGADVDPVATVSWDDASAYARWLTAMTGNHCRLPSESEWEYACRAGTTTEFAVPATAQGSNDIAGKGLANCAGCSSASVEPKVAPAGSFPANGWGLQDMHGNVWEWVEDCWHGDYTTAPEDGRAWLEANGGQCGTRVLRGGSWGSNPVVLRCASRVRNDSFFRSYLAGFRVVCSSSSF